MLDRVEAEADDPAAALLAVTVIDPACGSGHFLLAAARRIATRLARARTGGVASPADYRHALRDVARACIHGVDRNPMAVELTKVALWIETVEPGKPLGFLDANIRCGDSLLGVFDLEALAEGIPDAAYKPLAGDDKETAKHFSPRNRAEREGPGQPRFRGGGGQLPTARRCRRATGFARHAGGRPGKESRASAARFEAVHADPRCVGHADSPATSMSRLSSRRRRGRAGALTRGKRPIVSRPPLDVWHSACRQATATAARRGCRDLAGSGARLPLAAGISGCAWRSSAGSTWCSATRRGSASSCRSRSSSPRAIRRSRRRRTPRRAGG